MQAGGHRFDPGQLHQILIYCFLIAANDVDADQEAGWLAIFAGSAGFNRLRAGPSHVKVWIFDNEIDWVTCSQEQFRRREAQGRAQDLESNVKYKAEHMHMS